MDTLNTCFVLTEYIHSVAYYSHLVPVAIAGVLSIIVLSKARTPAAIAFSVFCLLFSLWLIADLVLWAGAGYNITFALWSWLDLVNIAFFAVGAYFFALVFRGRIALWELILLASLCVPAFVMTFFGHSVIDFNQPVCEATNNELLTYYKFFAESIATLLVIYSFVITITKKTLLQRWQLIITFSAMLAFFAIFATTEFVASSTGLYEINLYGLFILPVFLIVMTFAITDLKLFQLRFVSTQVFIYILIIMIGSQLLFVTSTTNQILTIITLGISIFLGFLLIENTAREARQLVKIEKLAGELENANNQLKDVNEKLKAIDVKKDEFLSIASHQLRTPIATIKGYAANLLDESYGKLHDTLRKPLEIIRDTSQLMSMYIEDYLNISRIEQGRMKYEFNTFDLHALLKEVQQEFKPSAQKRRLTLTLKAGKKFEVYADMGKVKQIIGNIVDNAIKYTEQGGIKLALARKDDDAVITVEDTGMGIASDEISQLFTKFKRSRDAHNVSMSGTGLGLYVVKQLVEGHGGSVRVTSPGEGRGSTFTVTLPIKTAPATEGN